jgi:hypothetical protein
LSYTTNFTTGKKYIFDSKSAFFVRRVLSRGVHKEWPHLASLMGDGLASCLHDNTRMNELNPGHKSFLEGIDAFIFDCDGVIW